MTINLPLEPQKEARLIALAHAKGLTADELVLATIDTIIVEVPESPAPALPVWPLGAVGTIHRRDIYDGAG